MAVTSAQIQELFPEFATVAGSRIDLFLAQAGRWVCADAFATTAEADDAIAFLTAHLLSVSASGGGAVTSRKVGNVSVTYSATDADGDLGLESTSYGRHYMALIRLNQLTPGVI